MSSIFAITSASDTTKLDATGKGEIPFTVSNSSGRQLRGRAEVKAPADPAKQSCLKIDGDAERDFPKDGVQQFTIRIQAPPGSQESKFSFRLDVLSVTNPDEDFTQGPTVSVVVPMLQKEGKKFPWWIVAAAMAVLAIVGVGTWLLMGRSTPAKVATVSSTTPAKQPEPVTPNPTPVVIPAVAGILTPIVSVIDPSQNCVAQVQGHISWNYAGTMQWAPANLARLCGATTQAMEPGRCFDRAMHGNIEWGGGTKWEWQNALNLCAGTNNSDATIGCFENQIRQHLPWQTAIAVCGRKS